MTRFYSATAQPTTLSAACTNSATTIQVTATTGFPAVEFILALDYGTAQQELVKVTGVAGTTLTVTRGFDSTTAQSHGLGAAVRCVHTADDFRLSRTHEGASSGVHGATGTVVGTSDAQTLTNKTLTSPKVGSDVLDTNGNKLIGTSATASAVNYHQVVNAATGTDPQIAAQGTDANVGLDLVPKGTGTVKAGGVPVATTTGTQTLTNKTVALGSNTVSGTTAQFNAALTDNDFATLAGSETLTNKTITSATFLAGTLTQLPLIKCTSATRPANVDGQAIYETDTDRILIADGTNWTRVTGSEAGTGAGGTLAGTMTSYASVTLPAGRWTIIGKGHANGSATAGSNTATITAQAELFDGTSTLDTVAFGETATGNGLSSIGLDAGFSLLYTVTLAASTTVSLRAKATAGSVSVSDIKLSAIPG